MVLLSLPRSSAELPAEHLFRPEIASSKFPVLTTLPVTPYVCPILGGIPSIYNKTENLQGGGGGYLTQNRPALFPFSERFRQVQAPISACVKITGFNRSLGRHVFNEAMRNHSELRTRQAEFFKTLRVLRASVVNFFF